MYKLILIVLVDLLVVLMMNWLFIFFNIVYDILLMERWDRFVSRECELFEIICDNILVVGERRCF